MQEKGNAAFELLEMWKFIFLKYVLWTLNDPDGRPKSLAPLGVIHFWGQFLSALFLARRERTFSIVTRKLITQRGI